MIIIDEENIEILKNGCVATLGFFDGVHVGHRFLIDELKSIAKSKNLPSVVLTFYKHPRKVLHADFQPLLLTTLDEKIEQLRVAGIDACVVLQFDADMARLSAYDFLKQVLLENYNVRTLLVGHDHRFGHNRAEGYFDYVRYGNMLGINLIEAHRFTMSESYHVSSSEIRRALMNGDIELSRSILGYNYSFKGKVVNGFQVGRKIGFPTANIQLEDEDKLIPAFGVYDVKVRFESSVYRGMMNIGTRPTIENGSERSIEVHIFDFNREIYNFSVEIVLLRKIRNEKKFANVDELITQLNRDKLQILKDLSIT
jgi:riboflavin kinase/FMN adenylyltransferase